MLLREQVMMEELGHVCSWHGTWKEFTHLGYDVRGGGLQCVDYGNYEMSRALGECQLGQLRMG